MNRYKENDIIEGTVIAIKPFGAIMIFDDGSRGLLHISEIANTFIKNIYRYLVIGKTYQVKVLSIAEDGFMRVSMSKITQEEKDSFHSQPYKRVPVNQEDIDFTALREKLDEWVKEGK